MPLPPGPLALDLRLTEGPTARLVVGPIDPDTCEHVV